MKAGIESFLVAYVRDGRRAQAGTTLVELLVSLTIAAFGLAVIVGTISTSLLDSTLVKRNAAVQAILEYEMEQVSASPFSTGATPYSDCFAIENSASPTPANGYQGTCPSGFVLRADMTCAQTCSNAMQTWSIQVSGASGATTNGSIQIYKVTHS